MFVQHSLCAWFFAMFLTSLTPKNSSMKDNQLHFYGWNLKSSGSLIDLLKVTELGRGRDKI